MRPWKAPFGDAWLTAGRAPAPEAIRHPAGLAEHERSIGHASQKALNVETGLERTRPDGRRQLETPRAKLRVESIERSSDGRWASGGRLTARGSSPRPSRGAVERAPGRDRRAQAASAPRRFGARAGTSGLRRPPRRVPVAGR